MIRSGRTSSPAGGLGFTELFAELQEAVERRDADGAFAVWRTVGERLDLFLGKSMSPAARSARAEDKGIKPGDLLHVTPDGRAFRAVASDAARYCTDWAKGVTAGTVTLGGAEAELNCLAPQAGTMAKPRLWLSLVAGKATNTEPRLDDGAAIRQPVGMQCAAYSGGKAPVKFQAEAEVEAW